jgi:hypothetical protein
MIFIKVILITIVVVGVVLTGWYVWHHQYVSHNTVSNNNISMTKTLYANIAYNYQLQYPASWNIRPENVLAQDVAAVDLQKARYISIASPSVKVAVSANENPQHLSSREYYDYMFSQRSYAVQGLKQTNKQITLVTVSGQQALKEKIVSSEDQTISLNFYVQKGEFIYTISITPQSSNVLSEEDIKQAQSVVDSITF